MKTDDNIDKVVKGIYKPYKSDSYRISELEKQIAYLQKTVNRLESFCTIQADMNTDLVKLLKLMQ
jgi:hypothetical protein